MKDDLSHKLPLPAFDRELKLDELITGIDDKKLMQSLGQLTGNKLRLISRNKQVVLGDELTEPVKRIAIKPEMETIAYLEVPENTDSKVAAAAAVQIELLLKSSTRYLMASDLHLNAVQDDYDALQKKHRELSESENKFRELSENLEMRVTEQVKTIENSQRQLYRSEKMASIGQLAAGVAHEINNPIGFINSNLSTADKYIDDLLIFSQVLNNEDNITELRKAWDKVDLDFVLKDFKEMIKESIDGADRVTKIVKDLKDFSNIDHNELELSDINDCLRSVCNVTANQIDEKTKLELHLSELPKTCCRPGYLSQVFINILLNASRAIDSDSGNISINTEFDGGKIIIRITDNGTGIPVDILDRIFDPFFTTHDVGDGTGLGLSVSQDIIRTHKGIIEVESEYGKGTTFVIKLPIIKSIDEFNKK